MQTSGQKRRSLTKMMYWGNNCKIPGHFCVLVVTLFEERGI